MFRSKELQKIAERTSTTMDEDATNVDAVRIAVCETIPSVASEKEISISDHVLKDLDLLHWVDQFAVSNGGKTVLREHIVKRPVHDIDIITKRAQAVATMQNDIVDDVTNIAKYEKSVLWILSIEDMKPFHLLFPSWPVLRYINTVSLFVLSLFVFRGYLSPIMNILYPLSSIVGPYFYMNKYLKLNVPILQYVRIIIVLAKMMLQPGPGLRANAIKYVSVLVYIILLLYGIIQSFDLAHIVRTLRANIYEKMQRITKFITAARNIVYRIPDHAFQVFAPGIANADIDELFTTGDTMVFFYRLITNVALRDKLRILVQKVYVADAICGIARISKLPGWTRCNFSTTTTLWGMGHPLLTHKRQVRNPISLAKNIVITGPNAAGKTTYMKALCANMVLAQSIGFVCAVKNKINPVHAISTSIRVHDSVGEASLFEAEVKRCAEMVKEARNISASGKSAIYFLDEPMHSTPPTEGAATAMSIAAHLGSLPGIRMFMTTHYHQVTKLSELHSDTWMNVSMEAIETSDGSYTFPYRIRGGPSFQCIALEILKDRSLPAEIIADAIEMKNKICRGLLDEP